MYSSGTTAKTVSGINSPTILIPLPAGLGGTAGAFYNRLVIHNTGANDGFFSVDGGTTWGYIPGTPAGDSVIPVVWRGTRSQANPLINRFVTGGMSGVFAFADNVDDRG